MGQRRLPRRRKVLQKGFRKSYSLSRLIIEQLALRWVTRRDFLSRIAVDFYRGGEDEEVPEERRRSALQQVSNILNQLKRKHLVFIVPRRFVVNVPRILYLYYINLPREARASWREGLEVERHTKALYAVMGAFRENLGINFPLSEARTIAEKVISMYYDEFHGYLVTLASFIDKASKMLIKINEPDTNEYFNKRLTELVSQYLLDIVAMRGYEELVAEILELVREVTGYKVVEEVGEKWRLLSSKIHALSYDPDFRIASYARQFLEASINTDVFTSIPLL